MAICPFAVQKLIRPGTNDPRIKVVGAVLHVDGGNQGSLYNYFNGPSDGIESHFHVNKAGIIEQYRDTDWEADANYKGNAFMRGSVRCGLVSIETQGLGSGEWNGAQLTSIKRLLKWLSYAEGFPLQKIPTWNGDGVGYHIQFGSPGPWTPSAKVCPGPDRIKQFNNILVPWFRNPVVDDPDSPQPTRKVPPTMFVSRFGSSLYVMVTGDRLVNISKTSYDRLKAAGIPAPTLDNREIERLRTQLISEK